MSADRIQRLARTHLSHGGKWFPTECRGGYRKSAVQIEISESIKEHIKSFSCRESHYGRNKGVRKYLPPELSIKRMYRMWKACRVADSKSVCHYEKYRTIFVTDFNLGFGNPREDVCSYCELLKLKIKAAAGGTKKQKLVTDYKLHKLKAKKFYSLMKHENDDEITVCFDMEQNQPLPKLSVSEVFYARQVWLYNLAVLIKEKPQTIENTWLYTWLETEAPRGANEVASAVLHFLKSLDSKLQIEDRKHLTLKLFSDSCSSQNKNFIMMCVVRAFLSQSQCFDRIIHFFPIRGHSYMPPDRVFGRIEKVLRKREKIVSPVEYHELMGEHGTVKVLNRDWKIYNFKAMCKQVMNAKPGVKLQQQKVLTFIKDRETEIGFQSSYSALPIFSTILRKKAKFETMFDAAEVSKTNCVKVAKMKDVKKLLDFFYMPVDDETKEFYHDVFAATDTGKDDEQKITYDDDDNALI